MWLETVTVLHQPINWPMYLICVVGHMQDQSCIVGPTFTSQSFQVNWPFHSWNMTIWIFNLENPNPRSWVRFKSQSEANNLSTHIPFVPFQSALLFLQYGCFRIWPWKSKVKIIAQGRTVGSTSYRLTSLSFPVNQPSLPWDTAF